MVKKWLTVTRDWWNGTAEWEVIEVAENEKTITSKWSEITRNWSSDDPAVVIEMKDGTKVLKLESELN